MCMFVCMYRRLRRHKAAALTIDLPGVSGFPSVIVPYSKKISTGMFRRVHRLLGVTQVRATTSSSHVCQTGKKSRTYQLQSVALLCVASSLLSRESIFACQQCQATHGVRKHQKKETGGKWPHIPKVSIMKGLSALSIILKSGCTFMHVLAADARRCKLGKKILGSERTRNTYIHIFGRFDRIRE